MAKRSLRVIVPLAVIFAFYFRFNAAPWAMVLLLDRLMDYDKKSKLGFIVYPSA